MCTFHDTFIQISPFLALHLEIPRRSAELKVGVRSRERERRGSFVACATCRPRPRIRHSFHSSFFPREIWSCETERWFLVAGHQTTRRRYRSRSRGGGGGGGARDCRSTKAACGRKGFCAAALFRHVPAGVPSCRVTRGNVVHLDV